MIDAKDYNLIYFCFESGKQVNARRLADGRMAVLENGESFIYSQFKFRKKYKASNQNKRAWMKPLHARPGSLNKLYYSKKFRDYLGCEGKESTAS